MTWVLNILVLSVILSFTKVSDRENNGKINQLSLALFEILPKLKLSYESIKGYLSYIVHVVFLSWSLVVLG